MLHYSQLNKEDFELAVSQLYSLGAGWQESIQDQASEQSPYKAIDISSLLPQSLSSLGQSGLSSPGSPEELLTNLRQSHVSILSGVSDSTEYLPEQLAFNDLVSGESINALQDNPYYQKLQEEPIPHPGFAAYQGDIEQIVAPSSIPGSSSTQLPSSPQIAHGAESSHAAGETFNSGDQSSGKMLLSAIYQGDLEQVNFLIQAGVPANQATSSGTPVLCVAASQGHLGIARLLIDKGAEIDLADITGATPLHVAARKGHLEVVKLLIDKGANIGIAAANEQGYIESPQLFLMQLFIKKSRQIKAAPYQGATPLHAAAREGHLEVSRLLIAKGAKINATDNKGAPHSSLLLGRDIEKQCSYLLKKAQASTRLTIKGAPHFILQR